MQGVYMLPIAIFAILQKIIVALAGFFGLGILIGFHELGHFLFCKLFSIRTPSFSIGFGPSLFKKKIGETEFSLSAIPFGGYVEIAGAAEVGQGEQQDAYAQDEHSFAQKKYYQQFLVLLGGIIANLLFAYAAFTLVFMIGAPASMLLYRQTAIPVVEKITEKSRAQELNIVPGDRILEANAIPLGNQITPLLALLEQKVDHLDLVLEKGEQKRTVNIILDPAHASTNIYETLGITFQTAEQPSMSPWNAFMMAIQETHRWIKATLYGFVHIFRTRQVKELAGPVAIVTMTIEGAAEGFTIFLLLLAIISINLAMLNLVPLPILDGGQLLFYSIEALIRRPIPHKIREYIHIGTWIIFFILFLYLTAQDLIRLAKRFF
jgi:regulator of sigma E protease